MAKRIKHISELPDWFSLKKYEETKELNIVKWYEQLCVRKAFLDMLIGEIVEYDDVIRKEINITRNNPIINIAPDSPFFMHLEPGLDQLKIKEPDYSLAIHAMTIRELMRIEDCIEKKKGLICGNGGINFIHADGKNFLLNGLCPHGS